MTGKKNVQISVPPYNCEALFTVFQSQCITLESLTTFPYECLIIFTSNYVLKLLFFIIWVYFHWSNIILLHFADVFSTNWRFVAALHWVTLWVPFLQQLFCSLHVSLSHFSNSCNASKYFYGDLWSVIFDVTIVIILGCHKLQPSKMGNLMINVVYTDCLPTLPFSHLSPSPHASIDRIILDLQKITEKVWRFPIYQTPWFLYY